MIYFKKETWNSPFPDIPAKPGGQTKQTKNTDVEMLHCSSSIHTSTVGSSLTIIIRIIILINSMLLFTNV